MITPATLDPPKYPLINTGALVRCCSNEGEIESWDAEELAQGMNPLNGTTYWSAVMFPLPRLDETPSRGNLYLRNTHWYYNDGGTAVLSVCDKLGNPITEPLYVERWPKPSAKTVTMPDEWLPHFRADGRGAGVLLGLPREHFDDFRFWGRFDRRSAQINLWAATS